MSLVRQIRWTLILMVAAAFASSFVISTRTLREALVQQLTVKNIDNANALALSLSQIEKDEVTLALLLSAQFDTGHYRYIRLAAPDGRELASRVFEGEGPAVPSWFLAWVAVDVPPGVAQIQDGWKPYGTLTLASHEQYAYESIWNSALTLAIGLAMALALAALVGHLAVQVITAPLRLMVRQVRALTQRRFETVAEPRAGELREMAAAMNQAVQSLQAMFAAEARQIDELQKRLNFDRVTGLAVRELFMSQLSQGLKDENLARTGTLAVLHFNDLTALGLRLGRPAVESMLRRVARVLDARVHAGVSGAASGQLNGSDLAVLLPGEGATPATAEALQAAVRAVLDAGIDAGPPPAADPQGVWARTFRLGVVAYQAGESVGSVLTRADEAVSRADAANGWSVVGLADGLRPRVELGMQAWRQLITAALTHSHALSLQRYPIRSTQDRSTLHEEAYARLDAALVWPSQAGDAPTATLAAGDFLPMASRLALGGAVDLRMVELAAALPGDAPIAVNLGTESLVQLEFRQGLRRLLQVRPEAARRLLVEVPEHLVFGHADAFHELSLALQQMGVRVGIDFFGLRFDPNTRLETLGLSHVKLHPSLLQGLQTDEPRREVLARLCAAVSGVGVAVYAQGVTSDDPIALLRDLGVQGVTGPGVR